MRITTKMKMTLSRVPYKTKECTNETHQQESRIKECDDCAPFWLYIPICHYCGGKLEILGAGLVCRTCSIFYSRENAKVSF